MNKEDIIKKFEEKNFNKETIELLLCAIEDFDALCGKYVSIEEVVERICKNLNSNVEYVDMSENNLLGTYSVKEGKIQINETLKDNPEILASTFFHELLHCISANKEKKSTGFHTVERLDVTKLSIGHGLNEGITQYLTKKRNELKGVNVRLGYPILTMEVENIISIIGEENILNSYFNSPDSIEDVLGMYNIDYETIMISLDTIAHNEEKIEKAKHMPSFISLLFEESSGEMVYQLMGQSAKMINEQLLNALGNINSIEDFKKALAFIAKLKTQDYGMDYNQINGFLKKTRQKLLELNFDKNEIDTILGEYNLKDDLNTQDTLESLISDDKNETIINLYNLSENDFELFREIIGNASYEEMIKHYFFPEQNVESINHIIETIGKFISQHPEYDFDEIGLESFLPNDFTEETFDILQTSDGKRFVLIWGKDVSEIQEGEGEKYVSEPLYPKITSRLNFKKRKLEEITNKLEALKLQGAPTYILSNQDKMIKSAEREVADIEERITNRRTISQRANQFVPDNIRVFSVPEIGNAIETLSTQDTNTANIRVAKDIPANVNTLKGEQL